MSNLRLVLLLLVCAVLGAAAWLDNRPETASAPIEPGRNEPQHSELPNALPERDQGDSSDQDDPSAKQEMDAAAYVTTPDPSRSNPLGSIELSQLRDTVDRPLFASSRRRPPESAAKSVDAPAPAEASTFELLGVVIGGPQPTAILRKKSDGTSYRVQTGDNLAGWQVSKVEARAVLLERPEGVSENIPLLRP